MAKVVGDIVKGAAAVATGGLSTALLTGIGGATGGGGTNVSAPTPVPQGQATAPDLTNFAQFRQGAQAGQPGQGGQESPVQFGPGLSPLQQRSQIATGATAGNTGLYTSPEVARFYKDLAIRTLTDEAGNPTGSPLPVEQQYLRQVFGQVPRQDTTASFLSALLRSDGSLPMPGQDRNDAIRRAGTLGLL